LREYDGLCRCRGEVRPVPPDLRFRCCNHGYSRGVCDRFPLDEKRSAIRFHVSARTDSGFDLLCIEECEYAPLRSYALKFDRASGGVEGTPDLCIRAQAAAFCLGLHHRSKETEAKS
jgi:hypothetical protein